MSLYSRSLHGKNSPGSRFTHLASPNKRSNISCSPMQSESLSQSSRTTSVTWIPQAHRQVRIPRPHLVSLLIVVHIEAPSFNLLPFFPLHLPVHFDSTCELDIPKRTTMFRPWRPATRERCLAVVSTYLGQAVKIPLCPIHPRALCFSHVASFLRLIRPLEAALPDVAARLRPSSSMRWRRNFQIQKYDVHQRSTDN